MVVACNGPLSIELDEHYVPALIDVGALESQDIAEEAAHYHLRVRAERLAASRRAEGLMLDSRDRRVALFGNPTSRPTFR